MWFVYEFNPLYIPEYFTVYVTYPDDAIKKFLDPMANCDIENAIEMLSKPTHGCKLAILVLIKPKKNTSTSLIR